MLIVKPSEGKIGNTHFLFDDAKIVLFFQLKKKKRKKSIFFFLHIEKNVYFCSQKLNKKQSHNTIEQ